MRCAVATGKLRQRSVAGGHRGKISTGKFKAASSIRFLARLISDSFREKSNLPPIHYAMLALCAIFFLLCDEIIGSCWVCGSLPGLR